MFSGGHCSLAGSVRLWVALLLCSISFSAKGQASGDPSEEAREPRISGRVPGELIVRFKPGATEDKKSKALKKVRGSARGFSKSGLARRGTLAADAKILKVEGSLEKAAAALAADPDVLYVEPNFTTRVFAEIVPDDFEFESLYGMKNTGLNGGKIGADIRASEAWDITRGSSNIVVAVIDTGMDYFHEDLRSNMWRNPGEIPGNGIDDDSNGLVDDVYGYDFVSDDNDPMDDHFHGTHVGGTIGAVGNNGIGVVGVNWSVRMMAVKAFNEQGNGTVSWAVGAIEYAIANGARIINASWGLEDRSRALADAVSEAEAAGVLFVAAAGNSKTSTPFFPAGYESTVAVASTNNRDERSNFSNYGAHVDISAPGEQIISTMPDNRYDAVSGTSMSTPHVSGVAALILSRHPDFTARQVATILKNTTDAVVSDRAIGRGRVNAFSAVQIELPLPNATLKRQESVFGRVDLRGTASGGHFQRYAIYHGPGSQPTEWTEIHSSTVAVDDGVLMGGFDTSILNDGTHTLKLVVWNENGQFASDLVTVRVVNVQVLTPLSSDILRGGEPIVLRGTVFGQGRKYGITWSPGLKPTNWFTAGVTLPGSGEVLNGVLGTIDPSVITPNEFYSFRLSATNASGNVQEHTASFTWVDGRLRPGFPIHLPFDGEYSMEDWRQAKVADLDGDGHKEILIVDHGNSEGKIAKLLVYRDDGTLAWSRELNGEEPYADVPTIGDINGDGKLEALVDVGPKLYAFTHDGKDVTGAWPLTLTARQMGKVIADLDGDGKNEIIGFANSPAPEANGILQLNVYDGLGLLLQRWTLGSCQETNLTQRSFPVVANMDDDDAKEIVVAAGCYGVMLFDMDRPGSAVWTTALTGSALNSPIVADLNGNGRNEIVVATTSSGRGSPAGVYVLEADGEIKPGWPVLMNDSFETSPAVGDIDGDGTLEIAVAGSYSYKLHLLAYDGFDMPGWPVWVDKTSTVGYPAIVDIGGDPNPEVVFTAPGYMELAVWDFRKEFIGGVSGWTRLGAPISLSGANFRTIPIESSAFPGFHKAAAATFTDLDGNGKMDLIATSTDEGTYVPVGELAYFKKRSSIYAWELDAPFAPGDRAWTEFQHGPDNNGFIPSAVKPAPVVELFAIPDQIVGVGQVFQAIPLNQYLFISGSDVPTLQWSASGQQQLRVDIANDGLATITPPSPTWEGSERITFTVTDNATFAFSTNAVFEARRNFFPPIAVADGALTSEDQSVVINVLANDTDPVGGVLSLVSATRPAYGKAIITENGQIEYFPNPDFFGEDSFAYIVQNTIGAKSLGLVTVQVAPVNDAPIAKEDRALALEGHSLVIDVLANDVDAEGDPIQLISVTQPANGATAVTQDSKVVFDPQPAYSGTNVFTYSITDGKSAPSVGSVTIVIRPLNSAPVAKPLDIVVNRNSSKDIIYSADDADGDQLTFRILRAPAHGELFSYPTLGNYLPHKGFSGTDSFTYKASDGFLESGEAAVTITVLDVNNPPTVRPQSVTTRVNQAATFSLVATDLDEDPIIFEIVTQPKNGRVTGSGTNYIFTPNLNFLGKDEFTFRVSDGKDSTTAKFSVETTDKNTAPGANSKLVRTQPNTPISVLLTGADAESDPLSFLLTTQPKHGSVVGTAPNLTYQPAPGYIGPDRFYFTVNDGEFTSDRAAVTFAIAFKNALPVASNQTVVGTNSGPVFIQLAVKDSDNDLLQAVILKGPRVGRLSGSGTNFVYTPGPGFFSADTFTYKPWDGHNYGNEALVRIERNLQPPPPSPPAFTGIQVSSTGDIQVSLNVQAGQSFRLESSTDLTNWETLTNAVSIGPFLFNAPATNDQIYFRAINQ